eukprot:9472623-Pyramimonas_sp.AAC.1
MARARLVLNWAGDSCGCLRVLSIQPKILNWRLSSVLTLEFDGLQTADLDRRMAQATGSNLESRAGRGMRGLQRNLELDQKALRMESQAFPMSVTVEPVAARTGPRTRSS